jgi:RNA polymerase sigma factor (sigma-70 family)
MTHAASTTFTRRVHQLLGRHQARRNLDAELLERFVRAGDEIAFAELVRRHGPLVLGVCRRSLQCVHDAEDVFQATFLLLARKARSIRKKKSVASWLYGVARRLAWQMKKQSARRNERERQAVVAAPVSPSANAAWQELRAILDEELTRLPDKQRTPLLLCYLEGKTQDEASRELGWSRGTLKRRLERGRDLLRRRLVRRGLALPAALFATMVSQSALEAVPGLLLETTVHAALAFTQCKLIPTGVSASAWALANSALSSLVFSKIVALSSICLMAGAVALATGLAFQHVFSPVRSSGSANGESLFSYGEHAAIDSENPAQPGQYGDPLPPDAEGQTEKSWAEKLFPEGLSHDFGVVPRGAQSFHKFKMKNIFSKPLELALRVSCGCVTATPSVKVLQPFQEGSVDVLMDAKRYQGLKTVAIEVIVGPKYVSTARLTVSGNCRTDVELNPGQLNFGVVVPGQRPGPQALEVKYAGNADWRITALDTQNAPLDLSYSEIYRRPGRVGYHVSASLKELPLGRFKYEIFLKTNDPTEPIIPILVEGTVRGASMTAAPNPLNFGNLKVGESAEKLILLRTGSLFRVLSIVGLGDEITASWSEKTAAVQVIKVRYQPAKAGPLHKQLVIKTDLDQESDTTVAVDGAAEK